MKRSPLRRRSVKQAAKDAEWRVAREAALDRDNRWPTCHQHGLTGPCAGGVHVHHVLRRSQGGTNDLSNLRTLCRFHHEYVHTHVAEAEKLGLLERSAS